VQIAAVNIRLRQLDLAPVAKPRAERPVESEVVARRQHKAERAARKAAKAEKWAKRQAAQGKPKKHRR
jgi:hypothetical protein